jgi:hypothetical protein
MREVLAVIGILISAVVFTAGISVGSYYLYAFLAPKYEATRRDVMIESRAYSEGTIRELYTLQRQYQAAKTDAERDTIASAARHEFSIFPKERLPGDLQAFLVQVGG